MSVLAHPPRRIEAQDILPGDFTTASGFRRVVAVEPVMTTSGRGSKRHTHLTGVLLHRAVGDPDELAPDELCRVYREDWTDAPAT